MSEDPFQGQEQRIRAGRQEVLDAIMRLDALYSEIGVFGDPRGANDICTHALVIASWHRIEDDGLDTAAITHYQITDMPLWQQLGLCEAQATYARSGLLNARDDED